MSEIFNWLSNMSSFVQSVLGSAVFTLILWLVTNLRKWAISYNKTRKEQKDISVLMKHYIHKYYVTSNGLYYFTQGNLLILGEAFKCLLVAILIATYYIGINALINGDILQLVFIVVIDLYLHEAYGWMKDTSSEDYIKNIDPELKEKIFSKLGEVRDNLMHGDYPKDKEDDTNNSEKKTDT